MSRPRGVPTAIDRCPRICAFAEPGVPSLRMACSSEPPRLQRMRINHRDCSGRGRSWVVQKMSNQTRSSHYTAPHPNQLTKIVTPSRASVTAAQEHLAQGHTQRVTTCSSNHLARRKQRVASVGCVDTLRTSVDLRATTNKTDDVLNTLRMLRGPHVGLPRHPPARVGTTLACRNACQRDRGDSLRFPTPRQKIVSDRHSPALKCLAARRGDNF